MDSEIARQVAEIIASMSIDEIRILVVEMEALTATPEMRLRHALRALAYRETYPVPAL